MAFHCMPTRRMLIAIGIAAYAIILLTHGLGTSTQHAAGEDGPITERSMFSRQNDADLRLIKETVGSLRLIHTDRWDSNIPVAAKPLLTTLKHQLRDLIANRLRFEKRQASSQQLQARAIVDLSNLGLIDNEEGYVVYDADTFDRGYDYGDINSITVTRPRYDLDVIALTTTLGICCGEDTSLYLFRYEDEEWKLWLTDEKNDYDSIGDGRRLFEFGLSWPDESEGFFLVTANVNPWCTSNWQSLTYRVLRPGTEPDEPRVLLTRKETIYLGVGDPPYRLEVDDSSFTLRFYGDKYADFVVKGAESDPDDENLKELVQCRVRGNAVIDK